MYCRIYSIFGSKCTTTIAQRPGGEKLKVLDSYIIHEVVKYYLKINYDVKDSYCKLYSNKKV